MTRTHHRLASLLVCALLVLTACGGDPVAPPPLTLPTSSSPTASDTVQPESAEEFIRRWQATADAMEASGVTEDFEALNLECESCNTFVDLVDKIYRDGGYIRHRGTQIVWITKYNASGYTVRVRSGPTTYRESSTAPVKHLEGGALTTRVFLKKSSAGWRVIAFEQIAGSAS